MVKLRGRLPRSDFAHPPTSRRNGGHPHVILHPHLAPRPPQSPQQAFYRAARMIVYLDAYTWLRTSCRALTPWRTSTPGASSQHPTGASQSSCWQYRASRHALAGRQWRAGMPLEPHGRAVRDDIHTVGTSGNMPMYRLSRGIVGDCGEVGGNQKARRVWGRA